MNKAIKVNEDRVKAMKTEAINWIEEEVNKEIVKTCEDGGRAVLVEIPNNFGQTRISTAVNHLRKHGFSAEIIDRDSINIRW